ncbi:MAG: glycosyltransferase family 4 protein, partial [Lentisphaerae bacterium]|nr:glycosyltransferase family 4 protein [Lentisphaerota bacterium]
HSVRSPDGDCEGTPVAVLEAGASGLPVVAKKHAGIKDVVISGETGILVDEFDVRGMSRAMLELARDPGKAGVLGANARERIVSEFSQEQRLGRLAEILEEAVGRGTA